MIFAYQSSICFTRWLQKQFMRKREAGEQREREREREEREREKERERERVAFLVYALLSINDLNFTHFLSIG